MATRIGKGPISKIPLGNDVSVIKIRTPQKEKSALQDALKPKKNKSVFEECPETKASITMREQERDKIAIMDEKVQTIIF